MEDFSKVPIEIRFDEDGFNLNIKTESSRTAIIAGFESLKVFFFKTWPDVDHAEFVHFLDVLKNSPMRHTIHESSPFPPSTSDASDVIQ